MDIFLLILGFLFILLGIIGSFLPVLPGPITSWIGLLLIHFTSVILIDWTFLGITLAISIFVWGIDYVIPSWGTKKFGGSKFGVRGSMIGLIIGLVFFGPLGIILGPFLGALIGEVIFDSNNFSRALKAAFGSFVGFLLSTGLKLGVSLVFVYLYWNEFWEHKDLFF
jgi:uncharacterized protein YqgC (DUF456 family)